jgi:AcrR family transcriptional regulator
VSNRTPRQRELMDVGARLFARRGYHAVGINDISAQLGLTGPAFYRHFPSKESLLIAVLDDAITQHLEEVQELTFSTTDKNGLLEAMVAHHLAFVFASGDAIIAWRSEARVIPETERRRIAYLQRLYLEEWVRVVRTHRPDDDPDQVRVVVHATIGLLQSAVRYTQVLPPPELTSVLTAMALQVLTGAIVPVH